jgi:hypothetical protein
VTLNVTADIAALTDVNLSNATVTLTADPSGTVAPGCTATPPNPTSNPASECAGNLPLLVTGAAPPPPADLSGTLGTSAPFTTQFTSVVPDVYLMQVSGPGIPSQTAVVLKIAPDTTSTESVALNVLEGEISGTVSWNGSLQPQSPDITISGSGATLTTNCGTGSCTYKAYVPLGTSHTVSATLSGFTSESTGPLIPNPSLSGENITLPVIDRTVQVTASSGGPAAVTLAGATIELAGGGYDKTFTGTTGVSTFADVPPSASNYTATVTFEGASNTSSFPVGIAGATNPTIDQTVVVAAGTLSGNVSLAAGQNASDITIYFCSTASAATSAATCTDSVHPVAGGYTDVLPEGSYWVGQSTDAGFTDQTTQGSAAAVAQGATNTNGPTIKYAIATGTLSGNVSLAAGQNDSDITIYFCATTSAATSAATCTAGRATDSVQPVAGGYSDVLPIGSYWVGQSPDTGFTDQTTQAAAAPVTEGGTDTNGPTITYGT